MKPPRNTLRELKPGQLKRWILGFFFALLIPALFLINQTYTQLKWGAFHQHRILAEELTQRINSKLISIAKEEGARSFSDYVFAKPTANQANKVLQYSPLSIYPVQSSIPGMIGYFQVDPNDSFSTPLLPGKSLGLGEVIAKDSRQNRIALTNKIRQILSDNQLVKKSVVKLQGRTVRLPAIQRKSSELNLSSPDLTDNAVSANRKEIDKTELLSKEISPEARISSSAVLPQSSTQQVIEEKVISQTAFDQLKKREVFTDNKIKNNVRSIGRVDEIELESTYYKRAGKESARSKLKSNPLFQKQTKTKSDKVSSNKKIDIQLFKSSVSSFEFNLLESGEFVFYRRVWKNGQRYIQGFLINTQLFLKQNIEQQYRLTTLSNMSNLAVAYQGNVLFAYSGKNNNRYTNSVSTLQGERLYQSALIAPFNNLELIYSINELPVGPAGTLINWLSFTLFIILSLGLYLFYKLGLSQINLAHQQRDFVSAVSHELKTPLTSIRMYGEMLKDGMAAEDKKASYYNFIFDESERLSRLINNILQLARMTRNEIPVELKPVSLAVLIDLIKSKVSSQIQQAGFSIEFLIETKIENAILNIDADMFSQIVINIIDNSIKFSAESETKNIVVSCIGITSRPDGNLIRIKIRDFGPGIDKKQMRNIFKLFYRSENELTRQTVGTGIGLALVHQLTSQMHGTIDVINQQPGTEFIISFPAQFN